jgi:hypothetical protein
VSEAGFADHATDAGQLVAILSSDFRRGDEFPFLEQAVFHGMVSAGAILTTTHMDYNGAEMREVKATRSPFKNMSRANCVISKQPHC